VSFGRIILLHEVVAARDGNGKMVWPAPRLRVHRGVPALRREPVDRSLQCRRPSAKKCVNCPTRVLIY